LLTTSGYLAHKKKYVSSSWLLFIFVLYFMVVWLNYALRQAKKKLHILLSGFWLVLALRIFIVRYMPSPCQVSYSTIRWLLEKDFSTTKKVTPTFYFNQKFTCKAVTMLPIIRSFRKNFTEKKLKEKSQKVFLQVLKTLKAPPQRSTRKETK
jgi:hypothetical protein